MKKTKLLIALLFLTTSLFAQGLGETSYFQKLLFNQLTATTVTPRFQFDLNPFGNQLGSLGAAATAWNLIYGDTLIGNGVLSPYIIGGTATTSDLYFKTTTGVGATGADMHFLVGNNGATEAVTILNNGNVGIGTTPGVTLDVLGGAAGADIARFGRTGGGYINPNSGGNNPQIGYTKNNMAWTTGIVDEGSSISRFVIATGPDVGSDNRLVINNTGNVGIGTNNPLAKFHNNGTAMFGADTGASLTDSSLVVNYTSGSPVLNWYGTDGDTWNLGINTADGATFNGATTYNFDNNMLFADPGTSANSYSISLKADNATTVQEGQIQVMYGANPYMRFSPPNAAGAATAFIDLKSNQMIFPDSTSLTTNTGPSDAMLFKAVDNDNSLLYEVARLSGGTTPTFDLLAGRLTGALNGNSQNITGVGQLAATTYGSDGTVSDAELLYINTLSSNAQDQINAKAPSTSPTFATSITGSYLTASEILITDGSKNIVSAPVATYPSLTELSYVKGLSSAVQTQIGSKAPTANPTFTGTVKRSVTATITASTTQSQGQGALTTDVNEVSVVGNANDVVTLLTAVAGMEIFIINNGANTLQIFPASGDNLGAGVDTSTTLASGSNITFVSYNDTNWEVK